MGCPICPAARNLARTMAQTPSVTGKEGRKETGSGPQSRTYFAFFSISSHKAVFVPKIVKAIGMQKAGFCLKSLRFTEERGWTQSTSTRCHPQQQQPQPHHCLQQARPAAATWFCSLWVPGGRGMCTSGGHFSGSFSPSGCCPAAFISLLLMQKPEHWSRSHASRRTQPLPRGSWGQWLGAAAHLVPAVGSAPPRGRWGEPGVTASHPSACLEAAGGTRGWTEQGETTQRNRCPCVC